VFLPDDYNAVVWTAEPGLSEEKYGTERSALPDQLAVNGSIALPYYQNYIYNTAEGTRKDELILEYKNVSNYEGSNDMRFDLTGLDDVSAVLPLFHHGTAVVLVVMAWVLL